MDYLERNIKTVSQKTVLVPASNTKGSTILFFAMVVFWSLAVTAYRFM